MIPVSRPTLRADELNAVGKVFETGWLGMGSTTYEFEERIKEIVGAKEAVAVNTGTAALHLALEGFGIGPGDEVIVPSLTFVASVQAIIAAGAKPVFCEVEPETLLIDVDDVARRITPKTRGVVPVHYCGQAVDLDGLLTLAEAHDAFVIEDAAHAFGSKIRGRPVGSFGHATCFSFDPIKIITCGEGGAVALQDSERAEEIRRRRLLGIDRDTWHRYRNQRSWFYEVTTRGYRYHMPNFCAAVGLQQLERLEEFISRRREICSRYDAAFCQLESIALLDVNYEETAPFIYIVRVLRGQRDRFVQFLTERGVGTGIHYIPNHHHPFFQPFVGGPLPRTEQVAEEIVTVPLYSHLSDSEVDEVIEAVCAFDRRWAGAATVVPSAGVVA